MQGHSKFPSKAGKEISLMTCSEKQLPNFAANIDSEAMLRLLQVEFFTV